MTPPADESVVLFRAATGDFFRGNMEQEGTWRGEAVTWFRARPLALDDALLAERDAWEKSAMSAAKDRNDLETVGIALVLERGRAEKAEARVSSLQAENARLKEALDRAINDLDWIASKAEQIQPGNVSHLRSNIRFTALERAKYARAALRDGGINGVQG